MPTLAKLCTSDSAKREEREEKEEREERKITGISGTWEQLPSHWSGIDLFRCSPEEPSLDRNQNQNQNHHHQHFTTLPSRVEYALPWTQCRLAMISHYPLTSLLPWPPIPQCLELERALLDGEGGVALQRYQARSPDSSPRHWVSLTPLPLPLWVVLLASLTSTVVL